MRHKSVTAIMCLCLRTQIEQFHIQSLLRNCITFCIFFPLFWLNSLQHVKSLQASEISAVYSFYSQCCVNSAMRLLNEAAELGFFPADAFEHMGLIFFLVVNCSNPYFLLKALWIVLFSDRKKKGNDSSKSVLSSMECRATLSRIVRTINENYPLVVFKPQSCFYILSSRHVLQFNSSSSLS